MKVGAHTGGRWHWFLAAPHMPSTVVAHISYDPEKTTLRITYVSGMVYDYLGVPEPVYKEMLAYRSKGTYLNLYIKGKYPYVHVAH